MEDYRYLRKKFSYNCDDGFVGYSADNEAGQGSFTYKEFEFSLENNEFSVYYQPVFDLKSKKAVAVEALVRWFHPREGFMSPDKFIPMVEKEGRIWMLDKWVFNKVLQQKLIWEQQGLGHITTSINLSSGTLESDYGFRQIEKLFFSYNVDFSTVTVELTETAPLINSNLVVDRLNRLRSLGVKIALDDFGTGYSSLMNLVTLPIDYIKIPKEFTSLLSGENSNATFVKDLITMAHNLKYRIVAEGIENIEQLECLRNFSCDVGQGFFLSIPLSEEEITNLIKA